MGDWAQGLYQSEQARGLSGGSAGSVAFDDANPYYNYRLRKHGCTGDLIDDPALLWFTSSMVKDRAGLGTHIAAEIGEGQSNYTDVLLILSKADFERADEAWMQAARREVSQEFDSFCRREGFKRRYAHRPLGLRVLCDGGEEMAGTSLGLNAGEFVTGLLPNLYTGPVTGSYAVIGVLLNIPGAWEGYKEVGRLHNDQILFTLGDHWLDSFCHPALREAALYRLQQAPDGSFVHIISPDLQDRYTYQSTEQDGASVLTLSTRDGEPLAYLVLALLDAPVSKETPNEPKPAIEMPETPFPSIPSMAPPMLIDDELQPIGGSPRTVMPDAPSDRIFTLQERGALLQKVHFSAFMQGYDVYVGVQGELGTSVVDKAATFQVRKKNVLLVAHIDGVMVGGSSVPLHAEVPVEGDVTIEIAGQRLEYRDLRGLRVDGWPYVAEIRRPASSTYMIWGEDYQIGRSRECRVVLPDEPNNDNIHWKAKVGDGATIRARTGDIPKSRFYTDSIMVASEHGRIDLHGDGPRVVCTARHCYVYIRRRSEIIALYPTTSGKEPTDVDVQPGDEILIGNCLFHVGFSPTTDPDSPDIAPAPLLNADALADAVPDPEIDRTHRRSSGLDAPPAAGEDGGWPDPQPVALDPVGDDSITGDFGRASNAMHVIDPDDEYDEPTIPGLLLPLGAIAGEENDGDAEVRVADNVPPPVQSNYTESQDHEGYDEDWDEISEPSLMQSRAPVEDDGSAKVETPFPELGEEDTHPPGVMSGEPLRDLSTPPAADPAPEATDTAPEPPAPPEAAPAHTGPTVVCVNDNEAQFELGRPVHFVLSGWMINGTVTLGNHTGADLVLPENRVVEDQSFERTDYFRLKVRGRRGSLHILSQSEVLIDEDDAAESEYAKPADHVIDVIRRDEAGEEDFAVRMELLADPKLPDPRARFLALDFEDPLAAALLTRGLPRGQGRRITLGDGMQLTLTLRGDTVTVGDYLGTYRRPDGGYHPFFVQHGESRFTTAPEDGSEFEIGAGDRLVIGHGVYVLLAE